MSGFEDYHRELAELDHEIRKYAAICGVDLANKAEIEHCLHHPHADWASDKARQSLQGLLVLRIKLETEMLEQGFTPAPLQTRTPDVV